MNVWEWISTTTTVDNIVTTLGIGTLAILFATDRILTKGAHLRRVADIVQAHKDYIAELVAHHARELAERDKHAERTDESRKEWRDAAALERARADKATDTMADVADAQRGMLHVLESLDQAVKETKR